MTGPIATWSFSRLVEDYERCEYRAYLKYVKKQEIVLAEDSKGEVARLRGLEIHDKAEQYVRGQIAELPKELRKSAKIFEETRELMAAAPERVLLEEEWGFNRDWQPTGWMAPDVWGRVKLDRFVWLDNDKTAAELTDYKTGKKEGNEVKHGQQGQLYTVTAFMRYPSLEAVKTQFEYVDQGKRSLPKTYTREQAMVFLPALDRRARKMTEATTFIPKPNRINCAWCPFGPNKGDGSCEYGVET